MTDNNSNSSNNQQPVNRPTPPTPQKPVISSPIPQKPVTIIDNSKGAKLPPIVTRGTSNNNS